MSNSKYSQLEKPPITEAIFEVLYTLDDNFKVSEFDKFYSEISAEFVSKDDITILEAKIDTKNNQQISQSSEHAGYLFLNENKSKAIQIRRNGFAYIISNNSYEKWEFFKNNAWEMFEKIKALYNITNVNRISLRYINCINLPSDLSDIKDYILIAPDVPSEIPFGINKMFMQLTIPNTEINAIGTISQNFDVGRDMHKTFPYIIDIDVQMYKDYNVGSSEILSDFDKLREFKNQIFFNSITTKTLNLL